MNIENSINEDFVSNINTIDLLLENAKKSLQNVNSELNNSFTPIDSSSARDYAEIKERFKGYFSDYYSRLIDKNSLGNYLRMNMGQDLFKYFIESNEAMNSLKDYYVKHKLIDQLTEDYLSFLN